MRDSGPGTSCWARSPVRRPGQPRPEGHEVLAPQHVQRLARAGEAAPRRSPREGLDDDGEGHLERWRRIVRRGFQALGARYGQLAASREGLEPALVDQLLDEIRVGQHQPQAPGEPLAVARGEQQRGVRLREEDRRPRLGARELQQRLHQLLLALPLVDPRQRDMDVAREAGRIVGEAEEGALDPRDTQRPDHVDVAHHQGEGGGARRRHQAPAAPRRSSERASHT